MGCEISNLSDDQLFEAFIVSNAENVSGAQTNAEGCRPRAPPEAQPEAFVCTFQKLWSLLTIKQREVERQIKCFTAVTSATNDLSNKYVVCYSYVVSTPNECVRVYSMDKRCC